MVKQILIFLGCAFILPFAGVYLFLSVGIKGILLLTISGAIGYAVRGMVEDGRRKNRYIYRKRRKTYGRVVRM